MTNDIATSAFKDGPLQARRDDRRPEGHHHRQYRGPRSRSRSPDRHHCHGSSSRRDVRNLHHHHHNDRPSDHHRDRHHPQQSHYRGDEYDSRRLRNWDDRNSPRDRQYRHEQEHRNHHHFRQDRRHRVEEESRHGHGGDERRNQYPEYYAKKQPTDENLPNQLQSDPRGDDPSNRITRKASSRGAGRNTESFDPASTLVRPDVRVQVGSARSETFSKTLKHDDVVIVPELFGPEDDWKLYYKLVEEMTELQKDQVKGSEWISWHEGAHLIVKKPEASKTFQEIIDKLCKYFNIRKDSIGYRFNWYRDSTDWKPFHHDSAAFNPQRAKNQNIAVGVSFGSERELAFIRATEEEAHKVRMYFPQPNNGVFSFGRDVNIQWKHGVNALKPEDQDGKGRISIILWGLAQNVVEEEGSPPLLGSDGQGPHASHRRPQRNNGKRRN